MHQRIAFTGASGTGKSTLARWVVETWGLPINPVGARSTAAQLGFTNPYDVDRASQAAYDEALGRGWLDQ